MLPINKIYDGVFRDLFMGTGGKDITHIETDDLSEDAKQSIDTGYGYNYPDTKLSISYCFVVLNWVS